MQKPIKKQAKEIEKSPMPFIKKVVGKRERRVTLEDAYNKLCGIQLAYSAILNSEFVYREADAIGLSNVFFETLEEIAEIGQL